MSHSVGTLLARHDQTLYGRDGRGGLVDEVDELGQKIDRLYAAAITLAGTFAASAIALGAAIATHTI